MEIEKYIIDKSDLPALLRGEDLAIQPKGNIRGFCVKIAGCITNGDVIKAMFPDAQIDYHEESDFADSYITVYPKGCDTYQDYSYEYWNAPYKEGGQKMTLDQAIRRNPYNPERGNKSAYCRYLRYNVDGWYLLGAKEVLKKWEEAEKKND